MIYLLEDDANIRSFVLYALTNSGLEATGFERPSEFWEAMNGELPELVLLDIMLPEEDGLSVLAKLRKAPKTAALPVIMLTAKGSEYDKVIGLDSGADDYIVKPFGTMELISRIKALLRRTSSSAEKEYKCGGLYVNPAKHIVKADGAEIQLTFKEFELLCYLLENAGNVLTREKILAKVWDYGFAGESRTVDVHIRTLRQKLGGCGDMIETVRGVGYKFSDNSMG
ncbi:MAG: response regulator transcription factor [Oscillospiraceae bacterium]|nr:response regulator transcription factor [Oscillospiraceae bacterium]